MTEAGMPTTTLGSYLQLPIDVWERVANYMSLKEWARISRTCRATHVVRPKHIRLATWDFPPLQWPTVAGLQRYWGNAESMRLNLDSPVGTWLLKSGAAPLDFLTFLHLMVWEDTGPINLSFIVFLTSLLLQSPRLTSISLDMPMSMPVPPLNAVKHLMLCHERYDVATTSAISELRQLQTLKLCGRYVVGDVIECNPLDLTGLPHLQKVAIAYMIVKIEVPSGCFLHVLGEQPMISSFYWETNARKGQLETLEFSDWVHRTELPQFVSWSGCTCLFWMRCSLGTLTRPVEFFGPRLHHLRELYLHGVVISINLPQEVRLEVLHIFATDLMFACINAHALAKDLRKSSFVYSLLTGHGVLDVAVEMAKAGKQMSPVPASAFQVREVDNEDQGLPWYGIYWDTFYTAVDAWPCTCGACELCLNLASPLLGDQSTMGEATCE